MTSTLLVGPLSPRAIRRRLLGPSVLCLATLATTVPVRAGEDWPQLKHDALRSGDLPDRAVGTPLGLVAAVPLSDAVLTAPILVGGKALVVDAAGILWCVEAGSGKVLWKRETRGGNDNTGNVSSPAAIGEYVHFGTMAGSHCVVRIEDGSLVREIACGEPILASPVVGNGRVYAVTLGSRVLALEPDGRIVWTWDYVKDRLGWDRDRWSGPRCHDHHRGSHRRSGGKTGGGDVEGLADLGGIGHGQ